MSHRIQLAVVLAALLQAAVANPAMAAGPAASFAGAMGLPERVLHFPKDQSIGEIALVDENYVVPEISREFHPGYVFAPSQYLGPAQGEVRIPAGKCVCLHLGGRGVTRQQCLDCLRSLRPDDVQDLDFLQPVQADDGYMPYVARLTGMTHFCPVFARFTPKGWSMLRQLPRLEHICTPHGLTDADVAEIVKLPALREMEIVADRLTDAGLASLAKAGRLEVLHLEGNRTMTDDGLRAFAEMKSLRHLRLSGPFTDRGMTHLAAIRSLKVLWLEAPNVTEEGLRPLCQSRSIERLCVPLMDRITDRGVAYLRAMPKLKALGAGNAHSADGGLASLASLTSTEVLAIKGGSSLTDDGLRPLANMPKLRALEIYSSRITDQGLAYLYPCKTLDSIQIKSSVPVSRQGIAKLKTELPNVQILDISLLESAQSGRPLAARQPQ